MDYNKIIGSNIRYERQKRNLTIEELSEILDIAPGFLGLIERGNRGTTLKNLCRIADFFSITLDQLVKTSLFNTDINLHEADIKNTNSKNLAVISLIQSLDEAELDFVISMIKNLKKMSKKTPLH